MSTTQILIALEWGRDQFSGQTFRSVREQPADDARYRNIRYAWSSRDHGITLLLAELDLPNEGFTPEEWKNAVHAILRAQMIHNAGSVTGGDIVPIVGVWRLAEDVLAAAPLIHEHVYGMLRREAAESVRNEIERRERAQLAELLKRYPDAGTKP